MGVIEIRPEQLERAASLIRTLYITTRRRIESILFKRQSTYRPGPHWDGGETRSGANRTPIWPTLARSLLLARVNIRSFMMWRMSQFANHKLPEPNQLCTQKYIEEFLSIDVRDNLAKALEAQIQTCSTEVEFEADVYPEKEVDDIWRLVLTNEDLPMSSLFRFCCATRRRLKDIQKRYVDGAVMQYVPNKPTYDQVWKEFIPPKFAVRADARYEKLLLQAGDDV